MTTPLLVLLFEKVIAPRLSRHAPPAAEAIDDRHPVIVAGFGRVGQIVTRLLMARGFKVTIIEHDPNQLDRARRYGWKAYYGDAARMDLLESAGAAKARLIVLAIDDPEQSVRAAQQIRAHFPHAQLMVRAHSRTDAYEFLEIGVPFVRETFGAGLALGEQALRALGVPAYAARRAGQQFERHDDALLRALAGRRHDQSALISGSTQARADLELLLQSEQSPEARRREDGWH